MGAPALWDVLRDVVDRRGSGLGKGRIPFADSKRLKLSNSGKRHPLTHIEPGVLCGLRVRGAEPASDIELFARLGAMRDMPAWYGSEACAIPLTTTAEHLHLLGSRLGAAMELNGIEMTAVSCSTLVAAELNGLCERLGSKAACSFTLVGRFIRALDERCGAGEEMLIVVDRQGGRTDYAGQLVGVFGGRAVRTVSRSAERSVYETARSGGGRLVVEFRKGAEADHLPVALASMVAKYVRELAMARFNAHFGARLSELKPTAGYATDGARWLKDAAGVLSPEERRAIVRVR